MTIAGDIDALLSNYMSAETAEQLTADVFAFLSNADVISRLKREGKSSTEIIGYLNCVSTLQRIVPNKSRRAKVA